MGKTMMTIYQRLMHLSPEMRQVIIGAGLAFDPLPEAHYTTSERSDFRALEEDWTAVTDDLWGAIERTRQEYQDELKR